MEKRIGIKIETKNMNFKDVDGENKRLLEKKPSIEGVRNLDWSPTKEDDQTFRFKVGLNPGKGHSNLGQNSSQWGSNKGKKWNNLDATVASTAKILQAIPPDDSHEKGVKKGNSINQETFQ